MSEPIWLDVDEVIDMHAEQLAIFGGPEGIRDRGLLESAILRPVNQWNYGQKDMAALAAAYADDGDGGDTGDSPGDGRHVG